MREYENKIMECLKIINTWNEEPVNGEIGVWRVKNIFAGKFPNIKDDINSL